MKFIGILRNIVIIFSFTYIFTELISIINLVHPLKILPDFYYKDRRAPLSLAISFTFNFIFPIAICTYFFIKAHLNTRIEKNWGITALYISTSLLCIGFLAIYLSTFIDREGLTYVTRRLFGLLIVIPNIFMLVGVVKLLISLKSFEFPPNSEPMPNKSLKGKIYSWLRSCLAQF